MESLNRNIISIFEGYTNFLIRKENNVQSINNSIWSNILAELGLFIFPEVEVKPNDRILSTDKIHRGSYVDINDQYKSVLLENHYQLVMRDFYPSIVDNYIKSGIVETIKPIKIFSYLWSVRKDLKEGLSDAGYTVLKIWLQFFYGKIDSFGIQFSSSDVSSQAKEILYSLREKTKEWYYIEHDTIFFTYPNIEHYKKICDLLEYDYTINTISKSIFFAKKKYILGDTNTIVKGFNKFKK